MHVTNKSVYSFAVVTGASSGLGRSLALELAQSSQKIFITGRSEIELLNTKNLILAKSPSALVYTACFDWNSPTAWSDFCDAVVAFGIPDCIVLNSGIGFFNDYLNNTDQDIAQMLNVNTVAPTLILNRLLSVILEKNQRAKCRVCIVASHAAYLRVPSFAVYAATKAYLLSLGLTLNQELKKTSVRVQVFCPGAMQTKFQSRSGIPRILSAPVNVDSVARKLINSNKVIILTSKLDQVIYILSKLLPVHFFDSTISKLQSILIKIRKKA